jgi:hypothetical protein
VVYLKLLLIPQGVALFKKILPCSLIQKEHQSSNIQLTGRHVTFAKFVCVHTDRETAGCLTVNSAYKQNDQ